MPPSELREMRRLLKSIANEIDGYKRRVNSTEMLEISHDVNPGILCKFNFGCFAPLLHPVTLSCHSNPLYQSGLVAALWKCTWKAWVAGSTTKQSVGTLKNTPVRRCLFNWKSKLLIVRETLSLVGSYPPSTTLDIREKPSYSTYPSLRAFTGSLSWDNPSLRAMGS